MPLFTNWVTFIVIVPYHKRAPVNKLQILNIYIALNIAISAQCVQYHDGHGENAICNAFTLFDSVTNDNRYCLTIPSVFQSTITLNDKHLATYM